MTTLPPLPVEVFAEAGRTFVDLLVDGADVLCLELRPDDAGRTVLLRLSGGEADELTPPTRSVGSRVYEYGGGAALVRDGVVYFVDKGDQQIYRHESAGPPQRLTPDDARRYGDLELDAARRRVIAVCEDHRESDLLPPVTIVAVPLEGGEPQQVVAGHDFYATPRVSPDGSTLAYVAWDFPNMPWDDTELFVAPVEDAAAARRVAGGSGESVCHPVWAPDGALYFLTDRDDYWNIHTEAGPVAPMPAEQGQAAALGRAPYDVSNDRVVFVARKDGRSRLFLVDRNGGEPQPIDIGPRDPLRPRFAGDDVVCFAGSAAEASGIWRVSADHGPELLRRSAKVPVDPAYLTEPERLVVPTSDGGTTYAFYYPPIGATGPAPLLVMVHGGPVSATTAALRFGMTSPQFWTSRGYAVVDVNYRGSTGYGRSYRHALYHKWGQLEVDDCIDVAEFLVKRGDVDSARVVIRGGSAGGFTTLAALAFRDYFATGTAYFPVSDLVAFHNATHKFEARYDEQLIGPWDAEDYRRRSPIDRVGDITAPLLLIQGLQDRVCPPEQSQMMVDALRALGREVEYLTFEDEAHGFVRAESIRQSLQTEADFYERVLNDPGSNRAAAATGR